MELILVTGWMRSFSIITRQSICSHDFSGTQKKRFACQMKQGRTCFVQFLQAGGSVFYVELEASLDIRLERNVGEDRLLAKPSKRDLGFSKNELLDTHRKHRLNSKTGEVERLLPDIHYLRIDSTLLTAAETAAAIKRWINDTSKQQA